MNPLPASTTLSIVKTMGAVPLASSVSTAVPTPTFSASAAVVADVKTGSVSLTSVT